MVSPKFRRAVSGCSALLLLLVATPIWAAETIRDIPPTVHDAPDGTPLEDIAAAMPHQDPFLFLREAHISDGKATGTYPISGQEFFLQGHFKDNPVFPASIMLEALGQLAVFYFLKSEGGADDASIYFTGADGVRCHRVCKPGETLEMSVELKRRRDPMAVFSGKITVNGEKAVSVDEITLVFGSEGEAKLNGIELCSEVESRLSPGSDDRS